MEADLGVLLVTRSARGVALTEAGLDFTQRCERILAEVADAREAIIDKGGDMTGRVRVTAPESMGPSVIAPLLGRIVMQYPRLQIDSVFNDRIVDLIGEGFDLAIRIGEPREASLIGRKIAPVRATLFASPSYLERAGVPQAPSDLLSQECIVYSGGGDWRFRARRRWVSIRPTGRLTTDSGETILQWAKAGLGIGSVPAFLAENELDRGARVPLLTQFPSPEDGIYTLRPPGPRAPTRVALLIDALVEEFKSEKDC